MSEKKKAFNPEFAVNRRAFHDYSVLDRRECGIVLSGTEVKVDDETYLVIGERDVLAIVEK